MKSNLIVQKTGLLARKAWATARKACGIFAWSHFPFFPRKFPLGSSKLPEPLRKFTGRPGKLPGPLGKFTGGKIIRLDIHQD
jgi:hypothetical protein